MVEISLSGSGEGLGWVTSRGYSTPADTPEPVSIPAVPTLTVDTDAMTGDVILSWTGTASPYGVVRATGPDFDATPPAIIATGLGSTTHSDPVLFDGVNYFYSIEDTNIPPKIYGISATDGSPGDSVGLTGLGFSSLLSNNEVFIGGKQAVVVTATASLLTFEVPTNAVTGRILVTTPMGTSEPQLFTIVATSGLDATISSLAVDTADVPFVATTGTGADAGRVFTFDPTTGSRNQVGDRNRAHGLPTDNSNNVYYGNGLANPLNFGIIEFTASSGPSVPAGTTFRNCGGTNPCYVWGMGLDPDLTDFDPRGRIYVADGSTDGVTNFSRVRIVPEFGSVIDFVTRGSEELSFLNSPRGIVANRNSSSPFWHDVFIADGFGVHQYDSAVPGTLMMTYDSANSSVISPRQMDITPWPRERLLIADDGQNGIVMINPATDKSKVIALPVANPKAIAVDVDASGTPFAYVGEPTRVLTFPVHRTIFVSVWIANGAPVTERDVRKHIEQANAAFEICGFEVRLRDDKVNFFEAGALLDLDKSSGGCLPSIARSGEEVALLDDMTRRSSEPTDVNVYYLRSFTSSGIARTITQDCFTGFTDDTGSGVMISAQKLIEYKDLRSVNTLAHELGHILIDQDTWMNGNEHANQMLVGWPEENIMHIPLHPKRRDFGDPDQCMNIDTDATIFRGDP